MPSNKERFSYSKPKVQDDKATSKHEQDKVYFVGNRFSLGGGAEYDMGGVPDAAKGSTASIGGTIVPGGSGWDYAKRNAKDLEILKRENPEAYEKRLKKLSKIDE